MSLHRIVLEPGASDRHYWKDLWKYRGLFGFLAWRDILVRYKQTAIGIAWSVLRPLLTLLAVMAIIGWLFSRAKCRAGMCRACSSVAAATLPWTFFSTAFSESRQQLDREQQPAHQGLFPAASSYRPAPCSSA
jgi:lipopolysaccharide transport system permease protein